MKDIVKNSRYGFRSQTPSSLEAYNVGEEVMSDYRGRKKYRARITTVNGDGTYDIQYIEFDERQSKVKPGKLSKISPPGEDAM